MPEVEIPYVGGPLGYDDNRELREDWELRDGADGSTEGYVWEYRPAALHSDADPDEVHRYVLTRRRGKWEFIYEPDLGLYPVVPPAEPTDAEIEHLADVIANARLSGVSAGHYTLARMILDAGYRRTS